MNKVIFNEYNKTEKGLKDLLRIVHGYSDTYTPKLRDMERAYLIANPNLYNDIEKKQLKYFREAFSYKFYLATMHLEQILALSHFGKTDYLLGQILENIFDTHRTTENEVLLLSFVFEGFIVQGNSFLDFYLLYLCHIFKVEETNRMSNEKLQKALGKISDESFIERAEVIRQYFRNAVFGTGKRNGFLTDNWGELLKELRNSILHRDSLTPSFENQITLSKQITGDWHSRLQGISCFKFCTNAHNDMVNLVTTIAAKIYEVEWKTGPYKPNLWQ